MDIVEGRMFRHLVGFVLSNTEWFLDSHSCTFDTNNKVDR
jgi:hypothetical protein